MKIYIAGPMSGLPDHNLPAFAAATKQLAALGYDAVFNPGRRGVILGYTWRDYMRDALRELIECEAVALLDGWEHSRGAALEVHVAQALSMPVQPLVYWAEAS